MQKVKVVLQGQTTSNPVLVSGNQTSNPIQTNSARGVLITLNITQATPTAGIISAVSVLVKAGPSWTTLYSWSGLSINTVSQSLFMVYPAASLATGSMTAAPLVGTVPDMFEIQITQNSNPLTYNLYADLLI